MSNQDANYNKDVVLSLIPVGKGNAVNQKKLVELTGFNDRDIRSIVQSLRKEGNLICSNTYNGYWIAENIQELNETIRQLTAQKMTLEDTINCLVDASYKLEREVANEYE